MRIVRIGETTGTGGSIVIFVVLVLYAIDRYIQMLVREIIDLEREACRLGITSRLILRTHVPVEVNNRCDLKFPGSGNRLAIYLHGVIRSCGLLGGGGI